MSDVLKHVHETVEGVSNVEMTPPHPPRTETPAYRKAHHFLIYEKKSPCLCCGISIDTLSDVTANLLASTQMETHHYPCERSLIDAVDPLKVHKDFAVVFDRDTLNMWVDSPGNLIVLCDICHRSPEHGIHHLLTQDWVIQKYLYTNYIIASSAKDASTVEAADQAILDHIDVLLTSSPPEQEPLS